MRRRLPISRDRQERLETIELGDPSVSVLLRRSRGVRRLSLSVSRLDGRVSLSIPESCTLAVAQRFVEKHKDWLRATLNSTPPAQRLELGATIPFRGGDLLLQQASAPRTLMREGDVLWIGGPPQNAGKRALVWLREQARSDLHDRATTHAQNLGVEFSRLSVRDTRSRWGSCSHTGALSFSWRLVLAPRDVLDYVAAHEVAHLLEMNHSSRFWAHVERLRPDWRSQRDWLRAHGAELHRYCL